MMSAGLPVAWWNDVSRITCGLVECQQGYLWLGGMMSAGLPVALWNDVSKVTCDLVE